MKSNETGEIKLTPALATILAVQDQNKPSDPIPTTNLPSSDGAVPKMANGRDLPSHGIYGPGVKFYEWSLGNFDRTDDALIGDFSNGFPTEFPKWGQINAYIVEISGFSLVHFDAYGYIVMPNLGKKPVFAPFSHDALYSPEPTTLVLFLLGGSLLLRKKKGKNYDS